MAQVASFACFEGAASDLRRGFHGSSKGPSTTFEGALEIQLAYLTDLRGWLTLPESAEYLAAELKEEVSEADFLSLILEGHLTASINFVNGANAKPGRAITHDSAEQSAAMSTTEARVHQEKISSKNAVSTITTKPKNTTETGLRHAVLLEKQQTVYEFDDRIIVIEGVWDLLMLGNERYLLEHHFQQLIGGPAILGFSPDGILVAREDQVCAVYKFNGGAEVDDLDRNYYAAGSFPKGSMLVIRTRYLSEFLDRRLKKQSSKTAPLLKSVAQEEFILEVLAGLGFEATALPVTRGKRGAKWLTRQSCLANPQLFTPCSFEKAWKSLRAGDMRIKDET